MARARARGRARIRPEGDGLLLKYQSDWVRDGSRLKIAEKARQIGWTWATAYGLVRRKSLADARLDAWISSRDEIQARLFLEDCKAFADILQLGAQDLGERAIDDSGHTAYTLRFANGLRAHSMSSNPDAQAGKRGDRILDEFALHPDPRKLYAIAYPGITWGGQLEMFSTHRGANNFFAKLVDEIRHGGNPKGFSLHRVTLGDALEAGFLARLQEKLPDDDERQDMDEAEYEAFVKAGCPDEETWLQEYCCVPADDASAFLEFDLIDSCKFRLASAEAGRWTGRDWTNLPAGWEPSGDLYIGVDVGRRRDLTVIWLLERVAGILISRRVIELERAKFSAQEGVLWGLLERHPRVRRCCIDATGLGAQLAERARERFGWRVEEVQFTGPSKEELAYGLRGEMEDRRVLIPDDRRIDSDLRGIRKDTTASGNIRFAGERTADGHSDRFWALALAVHGALSPASLAMPARLHAWLSRIAAHRGRADRSIGG